MRLHTAAHDNAMMIRSQCPLFHRFNECRPGYPWHTERIGPVGEQMHEPAASEAEYRRRVDRMPERVIRHRERCKPASRYSNV